ncbi:uncharacterized protein LTHEOB_54 [Lasiodiplodia theobromae]|uniref:uncharacterized protein n=1 Tax=Lasiodiplodia theobromae TaxID=45133 RepID=UPI0015C384AC|nr:uncharacterized protein LTHEOB_54 [Lasiodiplodia theobromae]KAF4543355.1 hypothetical protein LTHEOB_54 [Lasiodiplodia theobromae]
MSAVGKIIGALVHGSQEATIALANLNFDFSLVKLDAPVEFRGLGAALTTKRREVAEDGSSHITARKLGALFKDILPPTPILIRQYGTRASEIAENRAVNPPASPSDGIFAEHIGIDGTSIWAAATSGEGAIAVHLLACMLARMFPAPEAISIWYELVENRKSEILASADNEPLHFATLAAAKVSLSRDQLAEWDISARSWLRTADEAKRAQQKQLMLIVRNINIPVHSGDKGTYDSVIGAWKTALTLMERLLQGEPQSVQGGDLLLGLASWHIYPNLWIFGDRKIRQNDPLVPEAGVLSIGVEGSPAQDETGPVWSLPLSHFRYYGGPYTATRFMCDDSERLSLDEFLLVSLGSLLGSWDEDIFGLNHIPTFLGNTGHTEDKLEFMRRVALGLAVAEQIDPEVMCIVYRFKGINHGPVGRRGSKAPRSSHFVYTTVVAQQKDSLKRNSAGHPVSRERHARWIYYSNEEQKRLGEEYFAGLKESLPGVRGGMAPDDLSLQFAEFLEDHSARTLASSSYISASRPEWKHPGFPIDLGGSGLISPENELSFEPEAYGFPESDILEPMTDYVDHEIELQPYDFTFVAGIHGDCGIYVNPNFNRFPDHQTDVDVAALDDVEWALSNHVFPLESLVDSFAFVETYSDLANSTIALKAIYRPLYDLKWAKTYQSSVTSNVDADRDLKGSIIPFSLSRELRFALLVYMETGQADVDPPTFDRVVAVCSGDSIFVSAPILLDPFESATSIALLTTPDDPLVKSSHDADWKVIGHEPFDGELLDSFHGTSLQLGFTNFKLPIDTGNLGAYDMDLVFMEAIIRVNDHSGTWIGDLNILKAMKKWTCVDLPFDCHHTGDDRDVSNFPYATAIDNWDEFLDEPDGAMVSVGSRGKDGL